MTLSGEQVSAMAPDPASLAAGKKLAAARHWTVLGRNDEALWGLCQGSAVYQVKIDRADMGYHCSCPSRKFPCKHSLGLLLMAADGEAALAAGDSPDWVRDWLAKRQARSAKKTEKQADGAAKPIDEKAQAKRQAERAAHVREGLDRIELWMCDRVREGLAGLERQPPTFFAEQAKRLVDAQAPGIAGLVARWGDIVGAGSDWPEHLLMEFGRLELLIHAYRRIDAIDNALASDIRQTIGWNLTQEEVDRDGERIDDLWVCIGQRTDDSERLRVQRSWLAGRSTGQTALIAQFSIATQPFEQAIVPGSELHATLVYYPGVAKQRARILARRDVESTSEPLPGRVTIDELLGDAADRAGRQPWLTLAGYVVGAAIFVPPSNGSMTGTAERWRLRDNTGEALPLAKGDYWHALALGGGEPCDVVVEWNGRELQPLGMTVRGLYRTL
jgi:hypothetical protein